METTAPRTISTPCAAAEHEACCWMSCACACHHCTAYTPYVGRCQRAARWGNTLCRYHQQAARLRARREEAHLIRPICTARTVWGRPCRRPQTGTRHPDGTYRYSGRCASHPEVTP